MGVGIIWRLYAQMAFQHATQREISHGEYHSRTCLQRNTLAQTVHIQRCNDGMFIFLIRFRSHDRSQCCHLRRSQSQLFCFSKTIFVPKTLIFLIHTRKELVGAHSPIHLISIWYKKTYRCFRSQPKMRHIFFVFHVLHHFSRVQ